MPDFRAGTVVFVNAARIVMGMGTPYGSRNGFLTALLKNNSTSAQKFPWHQWLQYCLQLADHVINALPDNSTTARFVNAERINQMKPDARFYNIGRGAIVDTDAMVTALQNGRIASAYLDVTDPEPLLSAPLWNGRQIVLSRCM